MVRPALFVICEEVNRYGTRTQHLLHGGGPKMNEQWEITWKDYYRVLQVDERAEPEVIEGAYPFFFLTTGRRSRFTWRAREMPSLPGGTFLVMAEPAPT